MTDLTFVAIDFETANQFRASVCAVGLAWVRHGEVVDQQDWLIRPAGHVGGGDFNPWNVRIHGIGPGDVADAPSFRTLYPELMQAIGSDLLVAHNASFDESCFRRSCEAFGLPAPGNRWMCTYRESVALLPHLPDHRLPTVSRALGITQVHHHDAGDDALVAARVHIALQRLRRPRTS